NNLYYSFLADENNDNPLEDRFLAPSFRKDYLLSDTFVERLIGSGTDTDPEDPRLEKYAEPAASTLPYVGAPYGVANGNTPDYSFITLDSIHCPTAPGYFYTYAQVAFAAVEDVELGWISGSAATSYAECIRASMEQSRVDPADIAPHIAANPSVNTASIAYQK